MDTPVRQPQATHPLTPPESAALAISRALSSDRATARRPGRPAVALALASLLAAAGTSGYLAGSSGSAPAEWRTVKAEGVGLTLPPGWKRTSPGGGIETVAPEPLVAEPSGDSARRVIATEVPREGLGLFPRAAERRLAGVSGGEPVRLGRIRAARYRAVEADAPHRRVILYASPTARGVAFAACAAPRGAAQSFTRRCERVLATLSLSNAQGSRLRTARGVTNLNRAIARLDARRAAARHRLGGARTPGARALIVRSLADAHGEAARALGNLPAESGSRRRGAAATRALREVGAAYRRLARALRGRSRSRRVAARRGLLRRDAALRRAIDRLGGTRRR